MNPSTMLVGARRRVEHPGAAVATHLQADTPPRRVLILAAVFFLAVIFSTAIPRGGGGAAAVAAAPAAPSASLATAESPAPEIPPSAAPEAAEAPAAAQPPAAPTPQAPPVAVPEVAPKQAEAGVKPTATPRSPLPSGKGMWIWQPEKADQGDPAAIVARAKAAGISHIFVRMGSSRSGFHGGPFLDQILVPAHEAGLRVLGWDFPYLDDPAVDVDRALTAINYQVAGHKIDGYVADIETQHEGTNLSTAGVVAYSTTLRSAVGPDYPLFSAVPRPSDYTKTFFPYREAIEQYTAVMPMVYWLNREPDTDVAGAVEWLKQFGKPILPIGQAYDGAPEGGRPGVPTPDELHRFMGAAEAAGAYSVSFWSWQHANQAAWDAIRDAPHFGA